MSIPVGSRVGHYTLRQRLGAGGMGEVFLADDARLGRRVAVKFLLRSDDEGGQERVLREARTIAAIDHPNICAVYEVGVSAEHGDFIVMQYIEGETLAAVIRRSPLSPDRALSIAEQLADALSAAHAQGVIHRDLKPQNVIVGSSGLPKLLDFGISKRLRIQPETEETRTGLASQSREWAGTPAYMSPEQIRLEQLDGRSDLFSLGSVLYESITGHLAFAGRSDREVMSNVLEVEPLAPSKLVPTLDSSVDTVCQRLMAKAPAGRYPSAAEARAAIRSAAERCTRRTPLWKARLWAGVAAGALVIVSTIYSVWPHSSTPVAPPQAAQWYEGGVEALRDGLYVAARSALQEAVAKSPEFPLAYSRLAEAHSELDEESAAQAALLRVEALVPDRSRLGAEERLRLEAIRNFVLRDYAAASGAYRKLAALMPGDAGRWLDVGRAEEAAIKREEAARCYAQALRINVQYAAAHLRLGSLKAQTGDLNGGLASLDEAIRLYRAQSNVEGEAEGVLRKGLLLTPVGRFAEAQVLLDRVLQLASDRRYTSQRVRARFDMARLRSVTGSVDEGERLASEAVKEATDAGLWGLGALGLVDQGNAMLTAGRLEAAEPIFARAIELAVAHGAKKTEIRARLAQASLRQALGRPQEAIDLLIEPLKVVTANNFKRFEADAKSILGRSYEDLEQYDKATDYAKEVLSFAESIGDKLQIATALDSLAGPLTMQGRLPEALAIRERRESINAALNNHASLAFDLPLRAELLIRLGRGAEAEQVLAEVVHRAGDGIRAYSSRLGRVALLRALRAVTEQRFGPATDFARAAQEPGREDGTTRLAKCLEEYAIAMTRGRGSAYAKAPRLTPSFASASAREMSYWQAATSAALADHRRAVEIARAAWSAAGASGNVELSWRLKAIAARSSAHILDMAELGVTMSAESAKELAQLRSAWGDAAASYVARVDFQLVQRPRKVR